MAPTFTGVPQNQIGLVWDIALGYFDPVANAVNMVGYTCPPSGQSQEGMDVTDDSHLVQISSPNSTDRYARFPQVSQGDWSKGERQRLYIDAAMYYQSDGFIDVSTPGNLTLLNSTRSDSFALSGSTFYATPLETDGVFGYCGLMTGGNNFAQIEGAAPVLSNTVANGHEVFDLLYTPFALVGLTDQGLWVITAGHPPASISLVSESFTMPFLPGKSMCYLNDSIYYINNSLVQSYVKTYTRTGNSVNIVLTATASEIFFQTICSSASGIFFATTSKLSFLNFMYIWSGSTADPVQRLPPVHGRVEYAVEALGTVYVLVRNFQVPYVQQPAWTLYAVVGSQVSIVDDARSLTDSNFKPTCTSVDTYDAGTAGTMDFKPMLWSDGRFLYVAWPGLATKRIDLVNGGISQIGANTSGGAANVHARRFLTANFAQFIDISAFGTTAVINQFNQKPQAGSLTSSFIDGDAPGTGKIFRSIEFQSSAPLTGTQAIAFAYRLNQQASFTPLTTQTIGPRNFSAPFPANVKGTEIQIQVTLTADATAGAPTLTASSVIYDLGRVITITVGCRRNQQGRTQSGTIDGQPLLAKDLAANIKNIRNIGGGRGYAYIADETQPSGVSAIQIRLIDYQRTTPAGVAVGVHPGEDPGGVPDMEGDYVVQLTETFDP